MKKIISSILIISTLLFSCSSDDGGGSKNDDNPDPDEPVITGEFSTVEEGKNALENNAIEILEKIEDFNNDSALEQIIELAEFLYTEDETIEEDQIDIASTIVNITNLGAKNIDLATFNSRQSKAFADTLQGDFDESTGVYDYDEATDDFVKTAESDDVIYNIAYNGKNATFTISDFETSFFTPESEEVPTSVKSNLVIDGVTVFTQELSASVDTGKYLPNSYSGSIKIGELSLESELLNTGNNTITESISFKIGDSTIMYLGTTASGNFNDIDNNGDEIDSDIEDVLSTSKLTMSLLNMSVTFDGKVPSDYSSENEPTVDLLNDNIDIQLSVDNKLVANGEFYTETFIEYDTYFNGTEYVTEEYETESLNIRFKFPDDTTSDFDTYFTDSFGSVEDKFTSVFELFEEDTQNVGL